MRPTADHHFPAQAHCRGPCGPAHSALPPSARPYARRPSAMSHVHQPVAVPNVQIDSRANLSTPLLLCRANGAQSSPTPASSRLSWSPSVSRMLSVSIPRPRSPTRRRRSAEPWDLGSSFFASRERRLARTRVHLVPRSSPHSSLLLEKTNTKSPSSGPSTMRAWRRSRVLQRASRARPVSYDVPIYHPRALFGCRLSP